MKKKQIMKRMGALLLSITLAAGNIPVGTLAAEMPDPGTSIEAETSAENDSIEDTEPSAEEEPAEEPGSPAEEGTEAAPEVPAEEGTGEDPEIPAGEETEEIPEIPEEEPEKETEETPEVPAEEGTGEVPEIPAEEETEDTGEAPAEETERTPEIPAEEDTGEEVEETEEIPAEEETEEIQAEEETEETAESVSVTAKNDDGEPLEVTVVEIEDQDSLLAQVDETRISGELAWFKDISVSDHEGAVTVEIQLEEAGSEEKGVQVVHFPDQGEPEYVSAEWSDGTVSFTLDSFSPVAVYTREDLDADDFEMQLAWFQEECDGNFLVLAEKDDEWWDSLLPNERKLAEDLSQFILYEEDSAPDNYTFETLDEAIAKLESGIAPQDFFAGTKFEDLSLDDLYRLRDTGYDLDDLFYFMEAQYNPDQYESDLYDQYEAWKAGEAELTEEESGRLEVLQELSGYMADTPPAITPFAFTPSDGDEYATMSVSRSGTTASGEMWGRVHGDIYILTVGGVKGFCGTYGSSARNGYKYGNLTTDSGRIGWVIDNYANRSGYVYAAAQTAIWGMQRGISAVSCMVAASSLFEESGEAMAIANNIATIYEESEGQSETYYTLEGPSGSQDFMTCRKPTMQIYEGGAGEPGPGGDEEYETASVSASAEDSAEVEAKVTVTKHDSITDEVLQGAKIEINGSDYTTNEDGDVTHTEEDSYTASATGPSYTYVVDWGSLTPEQQADADANGYYHSYDAAYSASWGEANQQVQDELDSWMDSWSVDFHAEETAPPYGYCNNSDNTYDTTGDDGDHKYHDFYNKPWEAWLKVTKHDSVTGQTDFSLADADFSVYEYNKDTGAYELYRYEDRQIMKDNGDGTYTVGPLYYNPRNEGKFMILETMSPYGYTIDQTTNRFYFEITGEQQITYTQGNQYNTTGTFPATEENPHNFNAYNEPWKIKVDIDKVDENTGERLSGVKFDILRFNRDTNDYEVTTSYNPANIKVTEQPDGTYLSDWVYWNYQNQGKFYLVETEARKGYFGDWKDRLVELITGHPAGWQDDDADGKNAYYFEITGSRTEEGVVDGYNNQTTQTATSNNQGTITNERTKGRVTVVKYDTESESQIIQGDTTLEGAVYELRAAEDIIHADGHTGVIYHKGDLVMTGTIGKTPVVDEYGYMLNTDGQRYITYGGEIQYRDTPGEFSFYNIELGKYTLKEVKASEGYMLDETTYYLTFTYDDETQRVILRDETSADDNNTLTVDDQDTGNETIYTGDYVQKKAFSIVKTSDNQFQTELVPVPDAGFTVYLVSDLQGVKDGTLTPANGNSWSGLDIQQFYDYDFTQDQPATVYKRDMETWTEGDRLWLEAVDGGNANEYRVKEMFTDENGALTSPELPYGTYVVVETTTPEKHVMARPFFVVISEDGGVVYTDATKQEIQTSFTEETDIRYGDHNNAEIYKDPDAYDPDVTEGRVPQATRYISDNQTESYLRLVKADTDFLPPEGTILEPEKLVDGTVLKEGATYRIKIVSMTDREMETFTAAGWKLDDEDYIWYYEPTSRVEYGTEEHPFAPTLLRNDDGKIVDCYITLPAKLPTGVYEITELTAPSGYVQNGQEDILTDTSTDRENSYEVTDAPEDPVQFIIDNNSVYPNGQMGENKYTLVDSYGNLICTVFQDNKEQKGILELIKHGEKLYDADDTGIALNEKIDPDDFRFIMNEPEYHAQDYVFDYQDAPIEGAVFDIYAAEDIYTQEIDDTMLDEYGVDVSEYLVWEKDEKVATITTDKTGYAYLSGLYIGKYYIQEVTAGDGFVLNPEIQEFEITPQDQTVNFEWVSSDYENQRQKIALEVHKEDVEAGEPLSGAIYGLYNKNDIYSYIKDNPDKTVPDYRHVQTVFDYVIDDDGRLLIPADTLIATAVTDENGVAVFDEDLPLGEYYVKELEAPLGYTTTDLQTEFDMTYDGEKGGQIVAVQEWETTYQNQITKRVITKSDIVSGVYIAGAKMEVLEIAVDEHGNPLKENGEYVTTVIDTWISKAAGEDMHYFYEKDGFYFEIESPEDLPEGEELITKEGHLIEGLKVGRSYILRETMAPENYVGYWASSDETKTENQVENLITEEVRFTVTNDNIVAENNIADQRTVGNLAVTKEGEYFVDAEKTWTDQVKDLFYHLITYLMGRVEEAQFEVYAAETIYDPDATGNISTYVNSNGETVTLTKDALIDTITTDRTGIAEIHNLPLGSYYFKEVAAGDNFLLNPEIIYADLDYVDQDTPVVVNDSTRYENQRQRVEVEILKKGQLSSSVEEILRDTEKDGQKVSYELIEGTEWDGTFRKIITSAEGEAETATDGIQATFEPVQGTRYGLYAAEDIYAYTINPDQSVQKNDTPTFTAGELIEQTETDASGKAVIMTDLPNGKYYVMETAPAEGYLHDDETVIEIDASYTGQDGDRVLHFEKTFVNVPTETEVEKLDQASSVQIEGCTLQIIEEWSGNVVTSFQSGNAPELIQKLQLSNGTDEKIYILRETAPAPGYVTADDIYFKLIQAGSGSEDLQEETEVYIRTADGTWALAEDGKIAMKDDYTKVYIDKQDEKTFESLKGAELELRDLNGNVIRRWISSGEPEYFEKLPVGTYQLYEVAPPSEYMMIEEPLTIVVADSGEQQTFVLYNEHKSITIEKSTISKTQVGDIYKYTIDKVKNGTLDPLDDFTFTDYLPWQVRLTELWTGTYNQDLTYRVEYQISGSDSWTVWADNLDTGTNHHLTVPEDLQGKEGYITKFRFCFGTVDGLFGQVETPEYMVLVTDQASDKEAIINHIEVTATKNGVPLKDEDDTTTTVYRKDISGHEPSGGGNPSYEVTGNGTDESTFLQMRWPWAVNAPKTGDSAPILICTGIAGIAALAIIIGIFLYRRKRK